MKGVPHGRDHFAADVMAYPLLLPAYYSCGSGYSAALALLVCDPLSAAAGKGAGHWRSGAEHGLEQRGRSRLRECSSLAARPIWCGELARQYEDRHELR